MSCEYVKEHYGVPACIRRRISYKGRQGIITEDRGNYIGVTFDDEKPGTVSNFHPETEGLEYLGMGEVRPMTRSQEKYQDYLRADCGLTFAEYMGWMSKSGKKKQQEDLAMGIKLPRYNYI